jgi:hypothetical protein
MISWYLGPVGGPGLSGSGGTGDRDALLAAGILMLVRRDDGPESVVEPLGLETPIKNGFTPLDVLGRPMLADSER